MIEIEKLKTIEELLTLLVTLIQEKEAYPLGIMTQKELLNTMKISPNTLKSWESKGLKRLEPPIEGTRSIYYKIDDVISFLTP
ncbi:hypothetical protein [Streptococcus anginosus]|uniref:hypothetical protein n=1 Tax=Streptococcus anginosus TaxID=1328 RepID=UPI0022E7AEBB|nr:hypothetical protein [Streptococcus anginosus]